MVSGPFCDTEHGYDVKAYAQFVVTTKPGWPVTYVCKNCLGDCALKLVRDGYTFEVIPLETAR